LGEPWIGYWRWYSNDTGGAPNQDSLLIDVSNDGGDSWLNVEEVGPSGPGTSGGWFFHIFRVADVLTPSADVVLRFVASDLGSGSLVEAAIDDLVVIDCADCDLSIPEEVSGLLLDRTGDIANLSWNAVVDAAAYTVYRGTRRDASDLACFLPAVVGTSTDDDGLVPPPARTRYFVVAAVNCAGESELGANRTVSEPCP
jgi:hypothetical protein